MALRLAMLKGAGERTWCPHLLRRWAHAVARPPPLSTPVGQTTISPPPVFPEIDLESGMGLELPSFSFLGGSMELMAVPKKKVSPHKRRIRNGPKALKPVPVIVRCKVCGRVKLPHYFCCSGIREPTGEQNSPSN